MILEMKVPSPGESISEVEIAQWLVSDGDYVEKDQTIAEVDSDKATLDLPAEESGIITLKAEEGDTVLVGDIVCTIDTTAKKAIKKIKVDSKMALLHSYQGPQLQAASSRFPMTLRTSKSQNLISCLDPN